MDRLTVIGGNALLPEGFVTTDVALEDGCIAEVGARAERGRVLDAKGLLVLPGIVDIHGDAFERQVEPRPGVGFDARTAFLETDRQLVANGITTAFHAMTWSWEPGLRGTQGITRLLAALDDVRHMLAADNRVHLRHEIFNLAGEETICDWAAAGRLGCIAFNDHMAGTIKDRKRPAKMAKMIERSGLDGIAFDELVERVYARAAEVPASVERIAAAARTAGVPLLSHDDPTPAVRESYRGLGCPIAEFPITESTAEAARAAGDGIVFGAPNVLRGGSHTGCPSAREMVARGLCDVLASDYYYPSILTAPFVLAAHGDTDLATAWRLVSLQPARALGLRDRGEIAAGLRGDLIVVEPRGALPPKVVATLVAGRIAALSDSSRLR